MKRLLEISNFLIFSNLLIAFAAISQSFLTYQILQIPFNFHVILLEWSATILLYNFSVWLSMPKKGSDSPYLRAQWFFKHQIVFWALSGFAFFGLLYSLLYLHSYTFILLIGIGLLSLGYVIPLIRIKGKLISFRQIVGLKVFLIATVWSLSVVGMPVVEYYAIAGVLDWTKAAVWAILVALFILAITLPFDIRDLKQDQYYKLKTIPTIIGKKSSQILCYALIVAHALLVLFLCDSVQFIVGLLLTDFIALLIFKMVLFKDKVTYESVYLLDLMLIIQLVLVILL